MRYAYLGPEGTFTEAAVASLTGSRNADEVEKVSFPRSGRLWGRYAPVRPTGPWCRWKVPWKASSPPRSTTSAGGNGLLIRAETLLPIEFALLANPGHGTRGTSRTIGGHPQAQAQCRRWLAANLPGAEWVPRASNAEAARQVSEQHLDAALAGAFAAARYSLAVVAQDVHDRSNAVTRFVMVGPQGEIAAPSGADRSSLAAFLADDHPGALMEILTEFAVRGINLSTIQSRPTGDALGSYFFFVDCEGHIDDARVGEAMMGVRRVCADVRFLGSYPRSDGGRRSPRHVRFRVRRGCGLAWQAPLRPAVSGLVAGLTGRGRRRGVAAAPGPVLARDPAEARGASARVARERPSAARTAWSGCRGRAPRASPRAEPARPATLPRLAWCHPRTGVIAARARRQAPGPGRPRVP